MSRARADHRDHRARTAATWPSSCSTRATRSTAWCAASSTESFQRLGGSGTGSRCTPATCSTSARWSTCCAGCEPDEIYNLAAMSFVAASWNQPTLTAEFTGVGVTRMLEAMREVCPEARFYQASSSEMFGKVRETPQNEATPFYPRSPYGVAKAYGHFITVNYRESYGLYACSGILFNHESPRRGLEFVTRKVTHGAAAIKLGLQRRAGARQPRRAPRLGLCARVRRRDVADAAAATSPSDYVIGTGTSHSVRDLVEIAFDHVGLDPADHVGTDPDARAPGRGRRLVADSSKAERELGWEPRDLASRSWSADGRRRPRAAGGRRPVASA